MPARRRRVPPQPAVLARRRSNPGLARPTLPLEPQTCERRTSCRAWQSRSDDFAEASRLECRPSRQQARYPDNFRRCTEPARPASHPSPADGRAAPSSCQRRAIPRREAHPCSWPSSWAAVCRRGWGRRVTGVFGTQLPFTQCMPGTLPGQLCRGVGVGGAPGTQLPFTQCMPGTLPGQLRRWWSVSASRPAPSYRSRSACPARYPGSPSPAVGAAAVGAGGVVVGVFGTQLPFTQCMPGTLPGHAAPPPPPPPPARGGGGGAPGAGNAIADRPFTENPVAVRFDKAPKFGPLKATFQALDTGLDETRGYRAGRTPERVFSPLNGYPR